MSMASMEGASTKSENEFDSESDSEQDLHPSHPEYQFVYPEQWEIKELTNHFVSLEKEMGNVTVMMELGILDEYERLEAISVISFQIEDVDYYTPRLEQDEEKLSQIAEAKAKLTKYLAALKSRKCPDAEPDKPKRSKRKSPPATLPIPIPVKDESWYNQDCFGHRKNMNNSIMYRESL